MEDRVEFTKGDRYYKVVIDGMVVALCPSETTSKMCYFALTTYKENCLKIAKQMKDIV